MRLSFVVGNAASDPLVIITVMAADDSGVGSIAMLYRRHKSKDGKSPNDGHLLFDGVAIHGDSEHRMKGCEHLILRSVQLQEYATPLRLARGILERRGCQVVYDPRIKRYVSVGKIVKDSSLYYALGIEPGRDGKPLFQVQSTDEVTAKGLLTKEVVAAMQAQPARAAKLAGFFECGCGVKEVEGGEAPDHVPWCALSNADESALVVAPIKLRTRDDKDA